MNKLLSILAMLMLTGCAAGPLKVDVSNIVQSEHVQLTDMRPSSESEKETFSLLISSDAYAIYRNGDSVTAPPVLRLLQHRAYEKLASSNDSIDIKVFHFVSYMNAQSTLRRGAAGSIFGAVGAGIATASKNQDSDFSYSEIDREKFEATSGNEEHTRAYYFENENPNDAMIFVIYIDAEINGQRRIIRSVSPSINKDGQPPYLAALEMSINAFLEVFDA